MSNNTEEFWEANGVSLHTYAWSVETKAGRKASSDKRGEDVALPFRGGRNRVRKVREGRMQNLPMWVAGCNQDGSDDLTMNIAAKVEQNWDYLMSAIDISQDFPLVKRFYDDGVIRTVTGRAELLDPPDITVAVNNTWKFVLDLYMSDPWFYSDPITVAAGAINVEGNVETERVTLELASGARITTPDGNWIQYNGSGTAVIDCYDGNAKQGVNFVNGLVQRNPKFPEWLRLHPGSNAITGAGIITYQPAYR